MIYRSDHRQRAGIGPCATKTHPSYQDMISKLRRVLIAAQYSADQADVDCDLDAHAEARERS